jgi:hypothetical protein
MMMMIGKLCVILQPFSHHSQSVPNIFLRTLKLCSSLRATVNFPPFSKSNMDSFPDFG